MTCIGRRLAWRDGDYELLPFVVAGEPMNLRFLEAFVWVARLSSFTAAADKLCTTQAGISSRIATLEEQLGARLFERDRRSVTLTFHGTELLPLAEKMLQLQSQMVGHVGQRALTGTLRIGVMETVVHTWLPALLSRFSLRHPNVTIELYSDTSPHLRDELLRGKLDVAFQTESISEGFVENRAIASLSMSWVAAPTLALPPGTLRFADIAAQPIISFHRESIVYRSILQSASDSAESARPLRVNFFSSLAAMIELAKAGFGVAPLPVAVVQTEVDRGQLLLLDVEPPLAPLPVFASQRAEPVSPVVDELIALAENCSDEFLARSELSALAPAQSAMRLSLVTRKT